MKVKYNRKIAFYCKELDAFFEGVEEFIEACKEDNYEHAPYTCYNSVMQKFDSWQRLDPYDFIPESCVDVEWEYRLPERLEDMIEKFNHELSLMDAGYYDADMEQEIDWTLSHDVDFAELLVNGNNTNE